MNYRSRLRVQNDLEAIWLYTLKRWGAEQADAYVSSVIARFAWQAQHPQAGKARDEIKPGYRSFPQGSHLIFYTIREGLIEIIGVVHQSMDCLGRVWVGDLHI